VVAPRMTAVKAEADRETARAALKIVERLFAHALDAERAVNELVAAGNTLCDGQAAARRPRWQPAG
jgi:hypothetical protein